jgi:hypothetical protein
VTKRRLVGYFDPHPDTSCRDCGLGPWAFYEDDVLVHKDFYVHDALWNEVCPEDDGTDHEYFGKFVLCIGCFEKRLGRELNHEDFNQGRPATSFDAQPSKRFVSRWEGSGEHR